MRTIHFLKFRTVLINVNFSCKANLMLFFQNLPITHIPPSLLPAVFELERLSFLIYIPGDRIPWQMGGTNK